MRQAPPNLQALIQPTVESLGYELVGIEYLPQGKHSLLRVYIDSENGILLEDCEKISHQLSGVLDVEEAVHGHYNLEVSSPGLDRPLFTEDQFQQFSGQQVKVKLSVPVDGRKKFKGVIKSVSDGSIVFEIGTSEIGKKVPGAKQSKQAKQESPTEELEVLTVPFNSIDKANLIPQI